LMLQSNMCNLGNTNKGSDYYDPRPTFTPLHNLAECSIDFPELAAPTLLGSLANQSSLKLRYYSPKSLANL
jgi:hypothetical protein